jgi:hypothetical protein
MPIIMADRAELLRGNLEIRAVFWREVERIGAIPAEDLTKAPVANEFARVRCDNGNWQGRIGRAFARFALAESHASRDDRPSRRVGASATASGGCVGRSRRLM